MSDWTKETQPILSDDALKVLVKMNEITEKDARSFIGELGLRYEARIQELEAAVKEILEDAHEEPSIVTRHTESSPLRPFYLVHPDCIDTLRAALKEGQQATT